MGILGSVLNPIFGSFNRADNAEEKYGGVDRNNFNLPGFQSQYDQYSNMAGQNRNAPTSQYDQSQAALGQQLAAEAQGRGVGQQIIRQNLAQGQGNLARQQLSQAASARPGMSALAGRNAAFNTAQGQSQIGGQAANAGANMQLGAMGQYGNFLQGARGQDLDNQARMMGLNDQRQLELLRQRLQASGMQQQGGMGYEQNRLGRYTGLLGAPTEGEQLLGGLGGIASLGFAGKGQG